MALNDISLTAGMRSNLLSLQGTVDLLNRTQQRLSSGKKVNSAIDNPVSFFASQSLTSRASKIDSLKDAMGQAVQTIAAADKGISAITSMIEQAKGIAQQALSAPASTGFDTETVTINGAALGDSITIGGTALTAGPTAVVTSTAYNNFTMTLAAVDADDTVVVGGVTFTASAGAPATATQFDISGDDAADALALQTAIANYFGTGLGTAVNSNVVTITAGTMALGPNTVTAGTAEAGEIAIASSTTVTTTAGALGADEFAVTGDDIIDAQALANLINNTAAITGAGYTATASNGVVSLTDSTGDIGAGDVTVSNATAMAETIVEADSELLNLQNQYNEMRTQITAVANDSGYKGKNLLSADANLNTLVVQFEGNTLTVQGESMTAAGLGMTAATWTVGGTNAIAADLTLLDTALDNLAQNSSNLASNLSVITVRQDFSTQMINTLTEGSDKLTLADANQEGANMLMLQTRQSLSTTALSLSAQAAQSVLRLFQ